MKACPFCNYDLTGVPAGSPCPECGECVDPKRVQAIMAHPSLRDEVWVCHAATIGWGLNALIVFLPALSWRQPSAFVVAAVFAKMAVLSALLAQRRRTVWPQRFVRLSPSDSRHSRWFVPLILFAFASYFLPSVVCCSSLIAR